MDISLRLAATPKEVLQEGAEPFISLLLRGISLDVKMSLWKRIADVILKIIEVGDLDSALMPIFGGLAPLFLLKVNGSLSLEVDEDMKAKIQENPLIQPMVMDAGSLISATSNVSSEEEFEEYLNNLPGALQTLVKMAVDHLGDEVEFSVCHPHVGVKGRVSGEGLGLIARNMAKYISQ